VVKETHAPGRLIFSKGNQGDWESEVNRMETIGIRHVCCRIGIVLSKNGGALTELVRTMPLGVAGYFAKDDLYYPWIHIDDVCGIMIHAMETPLMRGSYSTRTRTCTD
jgi:NAD dependent epimerase/dehydratase family enzyme